MSKLAPLLVASIEAIEHGEPANDKHGGEIEVEDPFFHSTLKSPVASEARAILV